MAVRPGKLKHLDALLFGLVAEHDLDLLAKLLSKRGEQRSFFTEARRSSCLTCISPGMSLPKWACKEPFPHKPPLCNRWYWSGVMVIIYPNVERVFGRVHPNI